MVVILVVSGEARLGRHVRSVLGAQGWWVTAASDREAALRAAADHEPALVLVDNDLDGAAELVRVFGAENGGPGVLLLAPPDDPADSFAAYEAGADQILTKPPRAQDLIEAAERVMALPHQSAGAVAIESGKKLTSSDIFGDLLNELEGSEAAPAVVGAVVGEAGEASVDEVGEAPAEDDQPSGEEPAVTSAASGPEIVEPVPEESEESEEPEDAEEVEEAEEEEEEEEEEATLPSEEPVVVDGQGEPIAESTEAAAAVVPTPEVAEATAAPEVAADTVIPQPKVQVSTDSPGDEPTKEPETAEPETAEPATEPETAEPEEATAERTAETEAEADGEVVPAQPSKPAVAVEGTAEIAAAGAISPPPDDHRFGQYRLDERIAVGGMAEIWRASMLGMEGFRKTVAIKKILPHLAENGEFVAMFIEEAKLAAGLSHENLVEIYDLGKIADSYFIAMEYVDGKDLRSVLNRLRQTGDQMPAGLALLIGAEVAGGLEYAHASQDAEGKPLGLVHRDVSPRNVLIGHDGRVRLCDFGVAKAVSSMVQTEIGTLKGKLQYMSPEQASGKPVDARSDLYSLGNVLYELVTGRRVYDSENEISLLDAVRLGTFDDPRKHCPGLPEEVRRILVKALAKKPSARYQSAGELKSDLKALVRSVDPTPSERDLGEFVRELYAEPAIAELVSAQEAVAGEGATAPREVDVETRHAWRPSDSERSKFTRFWWGVVAGLLAAGLAAGVVKLVASLFG